MTGKHRSARCKHGFCTVSVGCEACGIKPDRKASAALRRCKSPRRIRNEVPAGYSNADGRKGGDGNSNARRRH